MDTASIVNFIEDYKLFSKRTEHQRFEHDRMKFSFLFTGFNAINSLLREQERINASQFNIFKILKGIEHLEVTTHSPMLGNLLDINGTHCQGNLFYSKFLIEISEFGIDKEKFKVKDASFVFVELEKNTPYGNLDILITSRSKESKFAILIENKIGAGDQPTQLKRYYQYLINSDFRDNYLLVYLTLKGGLPSEDSIDPSLYKELVQKKLLLNLSYKQSIVNMLNNSLTEIQAESVRTIVSQYLQTIKSF